jgi:hypothetical protein
VDTHTQTHKGGYTHTRVDTHTRTHTQTVEEPGEVIYTYDVEWKQSDVTWSHRWDVYFTGNPDDEIHYFSIVNSLMIVLFLTGGCLNV